MNWITSNARRGLQAAVAVLVLFASPASAQFVSGSDGTDGSITFALPSGQSTWTFDFDPRTICAQGGVTCSLGAAAQLDPDGDNVYHFTTVNITNFNVSVRLRAGRLRHTGPVVWLATGNVTISGFLDVRGDTGHAGGQNASLRTPSEPGPGGFPGGAGAKPGDVAARGAGPGGGLVSNNSTYGCSAGHVVSGTPVARCGAGGAPYGTTLIQPLIGGSGGSGGHYSGVNQGAGGGAGGGAIRITSAGTILVGGYGIWADGGQPGVVNGGYNGGAGSAGAIHLQAPTVTQQISNSNTYGLLARGLNAFAINGSLNDYGSDGRIRIDTDHFTQVNGTIAPTPLMGLLVTVPLPPPMPAVRVTSIGGIAVPPRPLNEYTTPDVSIDSTAPVSIEVAASQIPVGTVLRLHVTSEGAAGSADQVVNSTALEGTLASATATATVTLPQGVSRLYVRATW